MPLRTNVTAPKWFVFNGQDAKKLIRLLSLSPSVAYVVVGVGVNVVVVVGVVVGVGVGVNVGANAYKRSQELE